MRTRERLSGEGDGEGEGEGNVMEMRIERQGNGMTANKEKDDGSERRIDGTTGSDYRLCGRARGKSTQKRNGPQLRRSRRSQARGFLYAETR